MLVRDCDGALIPPAGVRKALGGDFDSRGVPVGFEIPTSGAFADVTVTDATGLTGKKIARPNNTPGFARVQGPAIAVDANLRGLFMSAAWIGGGSGSTTGQSRRHLRFGFLSDDGTDGAILEFLSPDSADAGTYLVGRKDGVSTRIAVNFEANTVNGRFQAGLWVTRNRGGGWHLSLVQMGQVTKVADLAAGEIDLSTVRPVLEWQQTYPAGAFETQIRQMTAELYWD